MPHGLGLRLATLLAAVALVSSLPSSWRDVPRAPLPGAVRAADTGCTSPPSPSASSSVSGGVGPAGAGTAAPADAEITLHPYLGPQTTEVTVSGGGFRSSEQVVVDFDAEPLGTDRAGGNGSISIVVSIPLNATPGVHTMAARGQTSGDTATSSFWVRNNWRQYLGNATHTSSAEFENVLDRSNAHALKEAWSFGSGRVGAPATLWNRAVLAVVNGQVLCMLRDDGSLRWKMTPSDGQAAGVVAVENFVAFVAVPSAAEVIALATQTGQLEWKVRVGGDIVSSPSTYQGVVYFGSEDHRIYAVSSTTGKILWSVPTGGPVRTTPAAEYGVVFGTSTDGMVYALDADRGSVKWRATVPGPGDPVKEQGILYVTSGSDSLYALSAADGRILWKRTIGDGSATAVYPPAVADGEVFVAWSGDRGGGLMAADADTGKTDWSVPSAGGDPPVVANGLVFASGPPSGGGRTAAYDASDGNLLWAPSTSGGFPIEADAVVYTTGLSAQGAAIRADVLPG